MLSFLERKFQCLLYLEGIMNDLFILSMRVSRTVIKNAYKFQIRSVGISFWDNNPLESYNYNITHRNQLKSGHLPLFSSEQCIPVAIFNSKKFWQTNVYSEKHFFCSKIFAKQMCKQKNIFGIQNLFINQNHIHVHLTCLWIFILLITDSKIL